MTSTAAMKDEFDEEFGEADFLEEIDVDEIVRQEEEKEKRSAPAAEQQPRKRHAANDKGLKATLNKYFGFSDFRTGQEDVIQALLSGRDAAVFWSTGQGKSLCYQIPAFHTRRTALIVSPLISLMEDQVHKLNSLSVKSEDSKRLATFLGSGQVDRMEESRACNGEYLLVYLTPEKLATPDFLDRLSKVDICLVAVDESHCVSEWGHDFRPDYRSAGDTLRTHSRFKNIPIVALTATAVPRIQEDIVRNLRLRTPLVSQQSFDRPNLKLSVVRKERGGSAVRSAMEPIVSELMAASANPSSTAQSTIVYAPTKAAVEEVAGFLQQRLQAEDCSTKVGVYHAGLPLDQRQSAHVGFLTGSIPVIVATVAFGMGIDKADVRRVVHYGPPKTVEEYYQQVGRAGRDGLPSECTLYVSETDFDKYYSDFYLGNLSENAKRSIVNSIKSLKAYALDTQKCRRRAILEFFNEEPSFGERCGTCDTCLALTKYGGDATRDFSSASRVLLLAINGLESASITQILDVISGKELNSYRYRSGVLPSILTNQIKEHRANLSNKLTQDQFRELTTSLAQKGYLEEFTEKKNVSGYDRSWTVFKVSTKGRSILNNASAPVILPVLESIRESERKLEAKRKRVLEQLEASGIDVSALPQNEVEDGDGEVIRSFKTWLNYMDRLKKNPEDERIGQAEELLGIIHKYRQETAVQFRVSPAAVLAEHTLMSIAYTTATMMPGLQMDKDILFSSGARTKNIDTLVDLLNGWLGRCKPTHTSDAPQGDGAGAKMKLPETITPAQSWKYAVYKIVKKTGIASWESSYNRFMKGEKPQAISINPANGRPIQVNTVVGHILDALVHGKPVDIGRLSTFMTLPTKEQWEQLEAAEESTGMDVTDDPTTSGIGGEAFTMTDFLRPIVGEVCDKPFQERSAAEKEFFAQWCGHLKVYMALKRAGAEPTFE